MEFFGILVGGLRCYKKLRLFVKRLLKILFLLMQMLCFYVQA